MPAPGQSTFDGNPLASPPVTAPYRPGSADFNGAALQDSATMPPNAATMPTAALLNTWSLLAVVFGRMIPNLTMSVRYSGLPIIDSFTATPSAVVNGTFTIGRTGGGAANGDVTITWPAGTFPAPLTQPKAFFNGLGLGFITIAAVTNGVRIITTSTGNVATDFPFTFDLM